MDNFQKAIAHHIFEMKDMMVKYVRETYNAPEFDCQVKIDPSPRRRSSWGGYSPKKGGHISLAINKACTAAVENKTINFKEYASFARDSKIGSIFNVSWKTWLTCLIAHEIAHVVQFHPLTKFEACESFGWEGLDPRNSSLIGHDIFWKKIYQDLRTKFVNGNLDEVSEPIPNATVEIVKPARKGRNLLDPNSKMGNARFLFLENTNINVDDFAKALIEKLKFEKYDAKFSAKLIIKEFADGKFTKSI